MTVNSHKQMIVNCYEKGEVEIDPSTNQQILIKPGRDMLMYNCKTNSINSNALKGLLCYSIETLKDQLSMNLINLKQPIKYEFKSNMLVDLIHVIDFIV